MPDITALTRTARAVKARTGPADTLPMQLNPLGAFGGAPGNSHAGWLSGTPMAAALPRDSQVFLQGAFGPLMPIYPQPIDTPREDTGRPDPRRWQYPVGWNLPVGIPGTEGIKVAAFQTLRQVAERFSVCRACIRVRREEVLGLDWDIIPTEDTEKAMRTDQKLRDDWLTRRAEAVDWFRSPDPSQYRTFHAWLGALLEEVFVTDALSIHMAPAKRQGLLGSGLGALELIDGTLIRPLVDMRGGTPAPPAPAYQAYYWGVPRVDLMRVMSWDEAEEMVSMKENFTSSQLLYLPYWQRVASPYGFSPVEQALVPAAIGIQRQAYLMDYYSEGSIPQMYVVPGPDIATATQRRQLQDTLNSIAGDIGMKFKVIVLPHNSTIHHPKDIKLSDGSDAVLAELMMMVFAVYAEELSMSPGGKAGGLGGAEHRSGMDDIRRRNRTKPLIQWLKTSVFDYVLQDICNQRDMQWSWVGLDQSEDEAKQAQVRATYVNSGILTRDEVRNDLSLPPFSLPFTGSPTVTAAKAPIPLDPDLAEEYQSLNAPPAPPAAPNAAPNAGPVGAQEGPQGATSAPGSLGNNTGQEQAADAEADNSVKIRKALGPELAELEAARAELRLAKETQHGVRMLAGLAKIGQQRPVELRAGDVHVELPKGMIQQTVRPAKAAKAPQVVVPVDARTTHVHNVDAHTEVAEGAVQSSHQIDVDAKSTPQISVDARTTVGKGAVQAELKPEKLVHKFPGVVTLAYDLRLTRTIAR